MKQTIENNEYAYGNVKFRYGAKIIITSGFYKNFSGTIKGYKKNNVSIIYEVQISIDGQDTTINVLESYLKIKPLFWIG